jgi:catechol 2,3-dioxygenase
MKDTSDNSEVIHPTLHHYGLVVSNTDAMLDWYGKVLGTSPVHQSAKPAGAQTPLGARADWVSNDKANHRIAFITVPGVTEDQERSRHRRLQHVAFEYARLDDLLAGFARLKLLGIEPVLAADTGATTAFYYVDPEHNIVELLADNFGNWEKSTEFMRTSADFAARPLGQFVDPDAMIAARAVGLSVEDVHRRAYAGEYPPAKPMDPRVLM